MKELGVSLFYLSTNVARLARRGFFYGAVFYLSLVCSLPAMGQEPRPPLHLAEALRVSLEKNPRIRQAQARVERTEGQVQRTLAPFRQPTLNVSGSSARLSASNAQSSTGGTATVLQNPFTVGLSGTAPGAQTVQLSNSGSSNSGTSGNTTTTSTATSRGRQTTIGGTGSNSAGGESPVVSTIDISQFGFSTALNQQSVGVSLVQRIDITGLGRAYQSVSNVERALAAQDLEQAKQEVIYTVTTAYYAALRSEVLIRVSEASVTQSEEQVRIAQVKFDAGSYAKGDVLRARSQLANNRQSLISARNQAIISQSALANDMGIDPATPIPLPTEEAEKSPLPDLPELNAARLLTQALAQRPEAVRAALNGRKARGNVRIARQGQEPSLNASLNGNYNGTEGIASSRRATGSVGVSLSFPLYDGGATAGNVRTARADERLATAQEEEYRNGIKAEVEQAIVAVRDAHDRADNALPALEDAREGYRLSETRLRVGVGTQLALYDAQATLVQAEVNAVNARYDYLTALA